MVGKGSVLVVEQDAELRDRMGAWLEDAGFDVLTCPGPSKPDYTCVAGRGKPCPLAQGADVVVLDLWLASDSVLLGTSSTELVAYYLASKKPVVAWTGLQEDADLASLFMEEPLYLLDLPPERRELCETVRSVLGGDR